MKIITNTAVSLDGRISVQLDQHVRLGSDRDLRMMSMLRNRVDAVLVGGNTFRNWPLPLVANPDHLTEPLRKDPLWNVIVSRTMAIPIKERFITHTQIRPLCLTAAGHTPPDFPIPVIETPAGDPFPDWIVTTLEAQGIQTLLIEGGGNLIFQFLAADLIDDMYITLCPKIIGRTAAPTLADGPGFSPFPFKAFSLLSCEPVGDEVYLHYGKTHDKAHR